MLNAIIQLMHKIKAHRELAKQNPQSAAVHLQIASRQERKLRALEQAQRDNKKVSIKGS